MLRSRCPPPNCHQSHARLSSRSGSVCLCRVQSVAAARVKAVNHISRNFHNIWKKPQLTGPSTLKNPSKDLFSLNRGYRGKLWMLEERLLVIVFEYEGCILTRHRLNRTRSVTTLILLMIRFIHISPPELSQEAQQTALDMIYLQTCLSQCCKRLIDKIVQSWRRPLLDVKLGP